MNYFTSGLKSVLGTQQPVEQPSGAETVERLVERVLSSTLLEDRRDACRALKSLSRKYRVEVGAHGMSAFTYVLQTDYADCETVGYALDALCNVTSDENFEEEEWQDADYKPASNLGAQFTEIFIKQPDNVGLILSFLEEYDFRVRWPAVKLLKSLLSSKPKEVQDIVLVSPMGVSKLMDILSDSREVIRNDALLLLLQLTKGNANIQKIVAFENAFDRLFDVINDEGFADGGIIVEDCLHLMLNLLRNNVSNQNFFKEGSYIQRLAPMFNILNDDELDIGISPQKVSNIHAVLQIIRTLVSPANPSQAIASCQRALRAAGIVEKLSNILMAGGVPVDVLTETITTVSEVIRGNLSNQEYFASVMAPSNPPREAIVVLLMSMVNERQPFYLRCAVLYCFECFLYRNELGQTKLIQTLLPSTSDQATVTAGQLLCGGLFSNDVLSHWLSSIALSHALIENPAAKESMLRVLLTPVSGHTPLSLLHHVTLLLQQSNKVQSKLGLLILLATWLSHCPPAIRHFLSIDTSISYLTTQAGATEHDDNEELVQGLCAFIMGICTHFNDDSVPSFSKENLRQLINKRVGLEVFLDKLNEVSRHEQYSRAVKHPNIRVNSPNDLLLDHEFCKLFKALEGLVMKAVTVSASDLTNGPTENIDQYKNLIREQDKRITELSMHYEALHAQNIQQAAKIQELSDQNLILKAQLSTNTASTQQDNNSAWLPLMQEKENIISRLEGELKNLRSQSQSGNKPLSAIESQANDAEIIYLKSQVQALHQTEKELAELRKDQEDLLELVADQEREIETLRSQLQSLEEKETTERGQMQREGAPKMGLREPEDEVQFQKEHEPNQFHQVNQSHLFDASFSETHPPSEFNNSDQFSTRAEAESPTASLTVPSVDDSRTETPTISGSFVNLTSNTSPSTSTPPTQISEPCSRITPEIFSTGQLHDSKSEASLSFSTETETPPMPLSSIQSEIKLHESNSPTQNSDLYIADLKQTSESKSPPPTAFQSQLSETCEQLASSNITSPGAMTASCDPTFNKSETHSMYSSQPASTYASQMTPSVFQPENAIPKEYSVPSDVVNQNQLGTSVSYQTAHSQSGFSFLPTTVFTPLPQSATYPYQQNIIFPSESFSSKSNGYPTVDSPVHPPSNTSIRPSPLSAVELTSQPLGPPPMASQPLAPPPMASQPVAPPPMASQPLAPPPMASQPVAPPPMASQPSAPPPMASQPSAPPPMAVFNFPQADSFSSPFSSIMFPASGASENKSSSSATSVPSMFPSNPLMPTQIFTPSFQQNSFSPKLATSPSTPQPISFFASQPQVGSGNLFHL